MKHPFIKLLIVTLLATTGFFACVDTDFDQPPTGGEPVNITPNTTIAQLKALHTLGQIDSIKFINGDSIVIGGVVVMDDESGNYYKALVIQDSTGGIEVSFNDPGLYTRFPVGRTIYIRCTGLLLTDYENLTQLSGSVIYEAGGQPNVIGLTEAQVRTRVIGGAFGPDPQPKTLRIDQLNTSHISTLIRLENVEFIAADTGKTYAEPITQTDINRNLADCNGKQLILRSSGFADFAGAKIPGQNGSIVGVLGVFRDDAQLYIRDLNDVKMDSARCSGGTNPNPCGEPAVNTDVPVQSINEAFNGVSDNVDVAISGWRNIKTIGSRVWRGTSFSGDKYVQATAFNSGLSAMETWLITPALDLSTQKTFSCETSWGFYVHDGLSVWVSNDFDGVNVTCATWTQLNVKMAKQTDGQYNWVLSGDVTLPILSGKSYIGFKYTGNTNNQTTTWRVDDVKVQ